MLDVRAFFPNDLQALGTVQEMQRAEWRAAPPGIERHLAAGPAWSIEGIVGLVAVGGLIINPTIRHRAYAWALVSDRITVAERIEAVRVASRMVRQAHWLGIERIEAIVRSGWPEGERVMRALGFKCEARGMAKYGPDRSAHDQWARV